MANSVKDQSEKTKVILEEINKLYDNDESPSPQMLETLDLFSYLLQKLSEIANNIHLY
jgi:hypothetical protein